MYRVYRSTAPSTTTTSATTRMMAKMHTHTPPEQREMLISSRLRMSVSLFRFGAHSSASLRQSVRTRTHIHNFPELSCIRMPKAVHRSGLRSRTEYPDWEGGFYSHLAFCWRSSTASPLCTFATIPEICMGFRSFTQIFVSKIAIFHRSHRCHRSGRKEIHSNWSHFLSLAAPAVAVAAAAYMRCDCNASMAQTKHKQNTTKISSMQMA